MSKKKSELEWEPKITHIMADGTVRDSVEGYEVPFNDQTEVAYRLLVKWIEESCRSDEQKGSK